MSMPAVQSTVLRLALAAVLSHSLASPSTAMWMRRTAARVPVDRLIANTEAQLRRNPENADVHFRLARLYGMAWAVGPTGSISEDPHATVPFGHLSLVNPVQWSKEEVASLDKAIAHYRSGLALKSDSAARLGLAYCLAQRGRGETRNEAKRLLREAGNAAWTVERTRSSWGMDEVSIAWEAAGYLIQLLDPKADAREIEGLQRRRNTLARQPRPITPIAVPLQDGLQLADVVTEDSPVCFDLDGSGVPRQWGWITPKAAWLVWDPHRSGTVDSGLWLFGTFTFFVFWDHGYRALGALDDDGDGWLRGGELDGLALWRDANSDGISDSGEIVAVARSGIVAVNTEGERLGGQWWAPRGVVLADGRTRPTWDIVFLPVRPGGAECPPWVGPPTVGIPSESRDR